MKKYLLALIIITGSFSSFAQVQTADRVIVKTSIQIGTTVIKNITKDSTASNKSDTSLITAGAAKRYADGLLTGGALAVDSGIWAKRWKLNLKIDSIRLRGTTVRYFYNTGDSATVGVFSITNPTLQNALTAGSVLTSNVAITGTTATYSLKLGAGSLYAEYLQSQANGFDFNVLASSNRINSLSVNPAGTLIRYIDNNTDQTWNNSFQLTTTETRMVAGNFISGVSHSNVLKLPSSTSYGFRYENENGVRYVFPRTRPNNGDVLKAADGIGTLTWGAVSGTGFDSTYMKYQIDSLQNKLDSLKQQNFQASDFNVLDSAGEYYISLKKDVFGEEQTSLGTTVITFSHPYISGSIRLYRNGIRLRNSQFTETSSTSVTLTFTPVTGDIFIKDYKY